MGYHNITNHPPQGRIYITRTKTSTRFTRITASAIVASLVPRYNDCETNTTTTTTTNNLKKIILSHTPLHIHVYCKSVDCLIFTSCHSFGENPFCRALLSMRGKIISNKFFVPRHETMFEGFFSFIFIFFFFVSYTGVSIYWLGM